MSVLFLSTVVYIRDGTMIESNCTLLAVKAALSKAALARFDYPGVPLSYY